MSIIIVLFVFDTNKLITVTFASVEDQFLLLTPDKE